jgi:type III secretory pathway component EscT
VTLARALEPLLPGAAAVALHGLRLLPAALLCPFLGGPLVPALVRIALAAGLGAFAWCAAGNPAPPATAAALGLAALREVALGTALGVVAAIPFEAARAGGRLADTLRGATLAELHVAPLRQRESATGDLLAQWALALAATAGGGRLVVTALVDTFLAAPVGAAVPGDALLAVGTRAGLELFACGIAVGLPAAAGVLAADLALAVAARAAPQLQLPAATQPARAALALAAIALPAAAIAGRLTSSVATASQLLHAAASGHP